MATIVHAPTSRSREAIAGNEEAGSELRLGEFQDVDALTHSEAALVINAVVSKRKIDGRNPNETECVYSERAMSCDSLGFGVLSTRIGANICEGTWSKPKTT